MIDFGTFAKVFKENRYLSLLHLGSPDSADAIDAIKEAVSTSPDVEKELVGFLADSNWRPNLVAAVAVSFVSPSAHLLAKCWECIDGGSWVSPQVAGVLSLRDHDFRQHAIQRLESGCRLVDPPTYELPLHKHVQAGPEDDFGRIAKTTSALIALLTNNAEGEALALTNAQEIQRIIASDVDGGGEIARRWRQKLERLSGLSA